MNPVTPLAPNDAQTLIGAAWILAAAVIGVALQRLLYWVLRRWAHVHHSAFAEAVVRRTGRAAAYVVPLLAILIVVPELVLPAPAKHVIEHAAGLLAIAAIAWSISALIGLWHDVALAGNRVDGEDDLQMRQRETRVAILGRPSPRFERSGRRCWLRPASSASSSVLPRARCLKTSSPGFSLRLRSRFASATSWSSRSSKAGSKRFTRPTSSSSSRNCGG
jgi:hypothetical protein